MDFNILWQNFVDTVTNHYVDFDGRVGRTKFWYYVLVVVVLAILVGIVATVTTRYLSTLFSLALLLPNLGMGIRRLHDIGKPWFYVLLPLVPTVLAIMFHGDVAFAADIYLLAADARRIVAADLLVRSTRRSGTQHVRAAAAGVVAFRCNARHLNQMRKGASDNAPFRQAGL